MAHSHSHEHVPSSAVRTPLRVRLITAGLLVLVAAATALGLLRLWPDYAKVAQVAGQAQFAVDGATFAEGEVLSVEEGCTTPTSAGGGSDGSGQPANGAGAPRQSACQTVSVGIRTGPDRGRLVDIPARGSLAASGLQPGDRVELIGYPQQMSGVGTEAGEPGTDYRITRSYDISGIFRHLPLAVLALLFAAVVVIVGRLRGLLALVALGISAGVLLAFVLPALVAGEPGLPVGLVGSSAIMFVILYLVHGPNMRTTAALIGTLCGILIMAAISFASVLATRLSGIGDEASGTLSAMTSGVDFRGLLTCSIIIAGLGVLNDVTITQSSAVWELRAAAPALPRREIYRSAMRIGRDHIASTVYTVFFAYVGAALSVLILLYLYDRPVLSLLTREDIAVEIVRTFCGSIGLVLAVPITTWVATLFATPDDRSRSETESPLPYSGVDAHT